MSSEYQQIWDGEWEPMSRDLYIACCDCGLVHRVQLRMKDGKLQSKFTVDKRRTGQVRRHARSKNPIS